MTPQGREMDLDEQLRLTLKSVRAEQARPDPAGFMRLRELIIRKAQRRRWLRTTGATLIASAIGFGLFSVPTTFTSTETFTRPVDRVATSTDPSWSADPWVVASARRVGGLEGDGWIPRSWVPRG